MIEEKKSEEKEANNDDNISNTYFEKNYNFKNPIEYNKQSRIISEDIVDTLEIVKSIDKNEIPIYENIFLPNNYPSKISMKQISKHYTTDTEYLEQTQQLIQSIDDKNIIKDNNIDLALNYYEEIKKETGFHEKYFYFDFGFAKQFNTNPFIMAFSSIYNIISPVISLCIPILILILPIVLIKLNGDEFNLNGYVNILKPLVQKTSIGSLFMDFEDSCGTKKIYLVVSAFFYCFSIYQNILNCIKFYSNIKKIYNYLSTFKIYVSNTLSNMKYFSSLLQQHDKYEIFAKELSDKETQLKRIYNDFENITLFEFNFNYNNMSEIGNIMTTFYKLYNDEIYNEILTYSFGFNGYLHNLLNINQHVMNNKLHKAKYILKENKKNKNGEDKDDENEDEDEDENDDEENEDEDEENEDEDEEEDENEEDEENKKK